METYTEELLKEHLASELEDFERAQAAVRRAEDTLKNARTWEEQAQIRIADLKKDLGIEW